MKHAPLALFWLLYMAGMGLVFPYQTLYFSQNAGLEGTRLGLLLGVRPFMGMLCQPLWGRIADRTGSRTAVLVVLALGNALFLSLIPLADSYPLLLLCMAGAAVFGTSVFPMATSVSMAALGARSAEEFGRIRVWGTVGFLILMVAFPPLLDVIQSRRGLAPLEGGPAEPGLGMIFPISAGFALLAGLVALRLPRGGAMALRSRRGDVAQLLRHGPYRRLLAFSFLAYLFVQGPIMLFPEYVVDRGGDLGALSRLWIPMLLLEIPLVYWSGAGLRRFGARTLLAVGVGADGLRWLACSFLQDLGPVYALQLVHGVVIAGLMVGGAIYVEQTVPERLRSTGQTLLAMLGFSLGGMLSSIASGWLIEAFGASAPYLLGGGLAVLLGAAVPWLLPPPDRPRDPPRGTERR